MGRLRLRSGYEECAPVFRVCKTMLWCAYDELFEEGGHGHDFKINLRDTPDLLRLSTVPLYALQANVLNRITLEVGWSYRLEATRVIQRKESATGKCVPIVVDVHDEDYRGITKFTLKGFLQVKAGTHPSIHLSSSKDKEGTIQQSDLVREPRSGDKFSQTGVLDRKIGAEEVLELQLDHYLI